MADMIKTYLMYLQVVVLTFESVDVQDDSTCGYDHLTVYDGVRTSDPELLHVCRSSLPAPLTSTGQNLHILFETDFNIHRNGFKLSWVFKGAYEKNHYTWTCMC